MSVSVDLSEAKWFKSSRSQAGKECVEAAFLDDGLVGVRDSKNPTGPALIFTPHEWDAFTTEIQSGQFDQARAANRRQWPGTDLVGTGPLFCSHSDRILQHTNWFRPPHTLTTAGCR